jgi:hypothetical protein
MRVKRTDVKHKDCVRAVKLLGLPHRSLHTVGGGVGDIIVLIPGRQPNQFNPLSFPPYWLELEVKTPQNKTNDDIWNSQYTDAQKEWREQTKDAPRETVTGFEDTLLKLRARMGK